MITYAFEASGTLKRPSDQELKNADEDTAILTYITGTTSEGRQYFAYIAVKPSKYREFHEMSVTRQTVSLSDYGTIVADGFGEPPAEVIQEMREKYGYDEHYAQRLKEEVIRQRQEFSVKQEAKRVDDVVAMLKIKQPNGAS